MSDAVCVVVCVCVCFAWEVGVCFVLRCLHEPFLLYSMDSCKFDIEAPFATKWNIYNTKRKKKCREHQICPISWICEFRIMKFGKMTYIGMGVIHAFLKFTQPWRMKCKSGTSRWHKSTRWTIMRGLIWHFGIPVDTPRWYTPFFLNCIDF